MGLRLGVVVALEAEDFFVRGFLVVASVMASFKVNYKNEENKLKLKTKLIRHLPTPGIDHKSFQI